MIIHHEIHGEELHDIAIYITERICLKRGHRILNGSAYADKAMYPGVPDVYIEVKDRSTNSKGRGIHHKMRYIVEIETNATKSSVSKKRKQFQSDGVTDLIVIPLNRIKKQRDFVILRKFIEEYLP